VLQVGVPAGLMQEYLMKMMPDEMREQRSSWQAQATAVEEPQMTPKYAGLRKYDSTAAVIQQLERTLQGRPGFREGEDKPV
jgi:hypothetical protein